MRRCRHKGAHSFDTGSVWGYLYWCPCCGAIKRPGSTSGRWQYPKVKLATPEAPR